jgi:hypothetical protein
VAISVAVAQFVISTVVCFWYYQPSASVGPVTVFRAIFWAFRYHLGSLCIGSVFQLFATSIKLSLKYVFSKAIQPAEGGSGLVGKVIMCLAECFEKFVKLLNGHIYIQIILNSEGYFTSSRKGLAVLQNNLIRIEGVCDFMMFFGKLLVSSASALFCHSLIKRSSVEHQIFNSSNLATLLVVFALSWVVASMFAYIWETSCDTIAHLCYLEREESSKSSRAGLEDFAAGIDDLERLNNVMN